MASRILAGALIVLSLAACDDDASAAGPDPYDLIPSTTLSIATKLDTAKIDAIQPLVM